MKNFGINNAFIRIHWKELTQKDFQALRESIDTIHHALQFVAIVGKYLLPPRTDDSHTAMEWISSRMIFAGEWINADRTFRVTLNPELLRLELCDYDWNCLSEINMVNKTKMEIYALLKLQLSQLGVSVANLSIDMHYDIPRHITDNGGTYKIENPDHFREIANYYSNAHLVLKQVIANVNEATLIRCWPHHIDLATNIIVQRDENGSLLRTIGVGITPPDTYYNEPYFYMRIWSRDNLEITEFPELNAGRWHQKDWTGAVLKISKLASKNNINDQVEVMTTFIKTGLMYFYNELITYS